MLVSRRRLAALVAAGLLAAPASALGQSAGDDQYEDPFAGEDQQQSQGGSDDPVESGGDDPAVTQAPETAPSAPEAAPPTSAPVTAQPQLPRTGADTGAILLAGSILLAGGLALRVRLRERPER